MALRRLVIDYQHATMAVELADGHVVNARAPLAFPAPRTPLRRAIADLAARELTLTLPDGREVTAELDYPPSTRALHGRPIVYLDQRDWITLAQELHSPAKIHSPSVRTAAAELVAHARAKRVVLPISAAHLAEAPMHGRRRRELIGTMLALSRGWQMRSPIAVRQGELRAALSGDPAAAADVFTLDPDALFADGDTGPGAPSDLPAEWRDLHRRLTSITSLYSAAIEDNLEPKDRAKEMALRWAAPHHRLAVHHRDSNKSLTNVRINARAYLLGDLATEIAEAGAAVGLDQERLGAWVLQGSERDFGQLPFLGRLYELLCQRLRSSSDHWSANDLVDMTFLCCAAGYATVVVGEGKTIDYLRRVDGRVPDGAYACSDLPTALEHLRGRGAA